MEMVEYLIERGADVNEKGEAWYTPIFGAAYRGDEAMVKLLLDNGAKIAPFGSHNSAFNHAAQGGHIAIVKMFLDEGADINRNGIDGATPLHNAVIGGHVEMVKLLLDNGGDVNSEAAYGATPLHHAQWRDRVAIGRILLENGADTEIECNGRKVSEGFLKKLRE
jgi:ankyrin repeat protein